MSGNGSMNELVVRGPKSQRKIDGPDSSAYWKIKTDEPGCGQQVGSLTPIVYGKVPVGYIQIYPENGIPLPLVEGEEYYIQVSTCGANGVRATFVIRNGTVEMISNTN